MKTEDSLTREFARNYLKYELKEKSQKEVFEILFSEPEEIEAEPLHREPLGERVSWDMIKGINEMGEMTLEYFTGLRNRKIMTGIPFIDKRTRGIGPGETMLIIARTSVGKTILGQNILHNMAGSGMITLFFSLEMTLPVIYERFAQMTERMGAEDFEYLFQQKHSEAKLIINNLNEKLHCIYALDQPLLSVHDIADYITLAETSRIGFKVKAVLIDYMGLINTQDQYGSTYERISQVAKELAGLAKQKQVALIVIHQTSRAGGSGNSRVTFDMARDSGVIEEAVDYVVTCWRPKVDGNRKIVLRLDKNRNGPRYEMTLDFNPHTLLITEPGEPDKSPEDRKESTPQPPEPVDEFEESDIPF